MKNTFNSGRTARDGESPSLDQNNRIAAMAWNFQTAAPTFRGGNPGAFRAFRRIGDSFLEAEGRREDRIEGFAFGLIVALAAWPMWQAAQAMSHLIK